MNITPDQARKWRDDARPGPWDASFDDEADATRLYAWGEDEEIEDGDSWELARHAPDLAQTIAGMTEQWRCEANFDGTWAGLTTWESSPDYARATMQRRHRYPTRLVRRLVGPVEVVE